MINSLAGTIIKKGDGVLYLQSGHLEWEIHMPIIALGAIGDTGREVKVITYLHHREDIMKLYGFRTEEERSVFLELLKVGGIGPKQSLRILSGMGVEEFLGTLDREDVDGLSRIPGLGKKTASKIILALRGKLKIAEETDGTPDELVHALVEMGFDRRKAAEALKTARASEDSEQEIFRKAIILLSTG
ncbi:MAG: Holliday junction branch migration protein RuvA [Spirochaetales bacterium]|nr:Holliday junction branch migration protein RuvA [Spirochaetales bacterium]